MKVGPYTVSENPYHPPNSEPANLQPTVVAGTFYRDAMKFSAIQQFPLLLLSSLILDGGLVFNRVAIASIGFWVLTAIILIRHHKDLTDNDILLIKWGYFPILLVTCVLWAMGRVLL